MAVLPHYSVRLRDSLLNIKYPYIAHNIKATPHKARQTALHAICLQIFRHLAQKFLDRRAAHIAAKAAIAKFLYNLTKNLTAHLAHKLYAVLP